MVTACVPSDSKTQPSGRKICRKQDKGTCKFCKKLDMSGHITDPYSTRKYITRNQISCQSNNLIYALQCTRCWKIYVGQTKRTLQRRAYEHMHDIEKQNLNKTIGYHFSTHNGHNGIEDLRIFVLHFSDKSPTDQHRKSRETLEKMWQFRLHSHHPTGLNTEDESPGRF